MGIICSRQTNSLRLNFQPDLYFHVSGMSVPMKTRSELLDQLSSSVDELIKLIQGLPDSSSKVYTDWSVKEVLAHVTCWHESFARNVSDLARGIKPTPLRGRYTDLNERFFKEAQPLSVDDLVLKLASAQAVISQHILDEHLSMIPYRIGSRDYSPEEHLHIVHEHIQQHIRDLKKLPNFAGLNER
jgi:hypothetical protein